MKTKPGRTGSSLTTPLLCIGGAGNASTVRYATGFELVDPVVFLQQGRKRWLVVPALEIGRAAAQCPGVTVLEPSALPLDQEQRRTVRGWALGLLRRLELSEVKVPPDFPLGIAEFLKRHGLSLFVEEAQPYPEREVKNDREIAAIRQSQRAAVSAVRTAVRLVRAATVSRSGELKLERRVLTSERIRKAVRMTLLEHDCSDDMDTIIACGSQAADPHERGHGPLRAGETIVLDIFPRHRVTGYWGDITRTILKGRATREQKKMYRAVLQAQELALSMIRPGAEGTEIHGAVVRYLREAGFETKVKGNTAVGFFHGTGHGVGLDIHEGPSLSLRPGTLCAGNVVTVEPGLYYPEIGGVRIEDTVAVTRTGYALLAVCPKVFQVR